MTQCSSHKERVGDSDIRVIRKARLGVFCQKDRVVAEFQGRRAGKGCTTAVKPRKVGYVGSGELFSARSA